MKLRRLGWLVIAAATTAQAQPVTSTVAPGVDATPVVHKRVATATRPEASAELIASHGSAGARSTPGGSAESIAPSQLRSLADDPVVGAADRIDGDEAKGVVAFTFDDGPNPETTPAVIDALEKYNVPAAFFIVTQRIAGKHGEKGRELLRRELDAGFLVGSHSVTHPSLKNATPDKLTREVDASIRALATETGRPIGMFRAPYGSLNAAGRGRLKKLRLTEVFWSVDTLDWKAHSPDRLRKKVLSMIKKDGGGVVLMHDVKPITARIIADVLDDLEAENCARLAASRDPIVPVSLHYFIKDGKTPRELPQVVKRRTEAYKAALPERCANRPAPAPEAAPRHAAK